MSTLKSRKIRRSKFRSCLKTLSKLESRKLPFSKSIMRRMAPWNKAMCNHLGVKFPPSFEEVNEKPILKIVESYKFSKVFLDNCGK